MLSAFRCYGALRLDLDARPVVLTGPNGAGKTNLLEAISFLAPGRGLRRARLGEVQRRAPDDAGENVAGASSWAVAATVTGAGGPVDIGTGLDPERGADQPERRVVRIGGRPAKSQNVLAEMFHIAWLTPEMDRLFLDGASGRRRFLDRIVYGFAPEHAWLGSSGNLEPALG